MTLAGSVQITLSHQSGQVRGVKVGLARPDAASRVLTGKTPEQVLDTVPILFSLCSNAQAYTALLALSEALGIIKTQEIDAAHQLLVQLETLREHAWQILLDWPKFIGLDPDKSSIAALLKFDLAFKRALFKQGSAFKLDSMIELNLAQILQLIAELEALLDRAIFNGRLSEFLKLDAAGQLQDWSKQTDCIPARLINLVYDSGWRAVGNNSMICLPELPKQELHQHMQQADLKAFVKTPQWQGHCYENTLLYRLLSSPLIADLSSRYGNGLLVRLAARLQEVAYIPAKLRQLLKQISEHSVAIPAPTRPNGIGLAQVQAARGLLIHRVELEQGQVYDYRVVAPTEWNFQPDGLAAASLKQLQAASGEQLRQQAELLIHAIDPCVEYSLDLVASDA